MKKIMRLIQTNENLTSCGSKMDVTPPHAVQPYLAGSREHSIVLVVIVDRVVQVDRWIGRLICQGLTARGRVDSVVS